MKILLAFLWVVGAAAFVIALAFLCIWFATDAIRFQLGGPR